MFLTLSNWSHGGVFPTTSFQIPRRLVRDAVSPVDNRHRVTNVGKARKHSRSSTPQLLPSRTNSAINKSPLARSYAGLCNPLNR